MTVTNNRNRTINTLQNAWLLALAFLTAGTVPGDARAEPSSQFSLCTPDVLALPLTSPDPANPGSAQILINNAAAKLGITVQDIIAPWHRCAVMLEHGKYDAASLMAYVGNNQTIAVFPLANGKPDTSKALGYDKTFILRRVNTPANFVDGKFVNNTKPVAVMAGRVGPRLTVQRAGATVDEGAKDAPALLNKLISGEVDLVLAAAPPAAIERATSQYHGLLEVLPTSLETNYYYLVFSKPFYAAHRELAERFWEELGQANASSPAAAH